MPDGVWMSNDRARQLDGDLFEQGARSTVADVFEQQAMAAAPSMVADAQDRIDAANRAQRSALADQFEAAAPQIAADHVASLTGGGDADVSAAPAAVPGQVAPAADNAAPVQPTPAAPPPAPVAPVNAPSTAPLSPAGGYEAVARAAAQKYGVDPDIFARQISQESGFNPGARSPAGAVGIAQFMPATAQAMGIDPTDPGQALDGAARLMSQNLQRYGGDYSKALAAYNAGPGNVDKYGGVPPFAETQHYVHNILSGAGQAVSAAAQGVQQVAKDPGSILNAVKPFLGQAYVWGGKGPQQGFDCSGLAGYLTTGQPESTTTLYGKSASVGADQAQPGDLVFWNMGSSDPHLQHVAVYLGNGQIVQSGGDQAAVNIGNVNQSIGSPPEFRRVGPGGVPAQAAAAPPNAPDPATPPAQQTNASPIDTFKQKLGDAFSDLLAPLHNLFGGGQTGTADYGNLGPSTAPGAQPIDQQPPVAQAVGNVFSGLGGALSAAGQNPSQAGPIGAFNAAVQAVPGVPAQLQEARTGLGQAIAQAGASTDVPVLSGAAQFAGGAIGAPSVLDNLQTLDDLSSKYGGGFSNGRWHAPDLSQMTPQEQAAYNNAVVAVGGLIAPVGAKFDKYGVALDQSPEAQALLKGPQYDQYGVEQGFVPPAPTGDLAPADIPNAVRARALGADRAAATEGLPTRQARLGASDVYGGGEAPVTPGQAFTRDPQGNIVPLAQQPEADVLQGLLQMARSRGVDTSTLEPQVRQPSPAATVGEAVIARPTLNDLRRTATAETSSGPLRLQAETNGAAKAPPPPATPPETPPPPPPGSLPAAVGAVPPSVPTGGANAWDYLRALRVGSLAGGVQTLSHIVLNAPLQAAFKVVSDAPLSITEPSTIPLEFMGAWQGLRAWASNAAAAPLGQPGRIAQSIGGTTGNVVETGLLGLVKTHPVIQDMANQLGTSMELWRQAGVEASSRGLTRFSGPWWTEVQNLVANPTADMAEAAQQAGSTFALRGPMGSLGTAVGKLRGENKLIDFAVPFFNIGYHVATQGVERSPLGLIGTAIDIARAPLGSGPYAAGANAIEQGVTPLAQRFRNNMVGTGLAVEAFHQAAQGNITGNGPTDPKLRADLLATGWQPDSVRIGGRYFPLHSLGFAGWPLAEAANLYEATHTGDEGGYATPASTLQARFGDYLERMAQFGENETFLRSIGQLLQAATNSRDAARQGEQIAAGIGESLIPQGALLSNIASTVDPYTRRPIPGDIGQAIQNRLPGMRQDLPLKLTPTGQPVQNPSQGFGVLLPRSSIVAPDPVVQAMGQAGIGAPTIPKTVSVTSKYQMDLTPDEQQTYQELHGQALSDQLKDVVTDPDWNALSVDRRRQLIQRALSKASDVARKQLLDQIPNDQIESRIQLKSDALAGNRVTVGAAP